MLMRTKLVESRQVMQHFKACVLESSKIQFVSRNMYIFREIHNGLLGIVISEYLAKRIIFSNSQFRSFKIIKSFMTCLLCTSLVLMKILKNGPKWTHFAKVACKIAKSKHVSKNLCLPVNFFVLLKSKGANLASTYIIKQCNRWYRNFFEEAQCDKTYSYKFRSLRLHK